MSSQPSSSHSISNTHMKTLHIHEWPSGYPWKELQQRKSSMSLTEQDYQLGAETRRQLLHDLYHLEPNGLKHDPLFHFFYEPEIIIRFSSELVRNQVKAKLDELQIGFVEYNYPTPESQYVELVAHTEVMDLVEKRIHCCGENKDGIVIRNLPLFLNIFHGHSVAALEMNREDHFHYMERVIHTMFNPFAYTRDEEGRKLAKMAIFKSGLEGVEDVLNNFDPWNLGD
ncbi:hypothetical protein C9374_008283 [Naegleria lovaniensis]|uniref:Uncharacterized protein n=1 Tax=Naegleria lovaniensis TaxID=51637 RepID=A0AA88KL96_NAELO|nr:uncharacterized protein C9374_008283 [Naegleria lovaniensis]KAG2378644.1 hypothetical protein C9374_008283 [Naegleria lovaniensis]